MLEKQQIIAGPCALETQRIARITIKEAKKLGIGTVRSNLWKPRTSPGFEGAGVEGLPWVKKIAQAGLRPAMEVLLPEHVDLLMEGVLAKIPHATLLVWIGSRNQNHLVLRDIGKAVAGEPRVNVMVKNQPWRDQDHWEGMVKHLQSGGASQEQLMLCHRGFAPWDKATSPTRNIADIEMALKLKEKTKLPLIMDPSHIAGNRLLALEMIKEFATIPEVDGQIIEVHPDPSTALTDAKQQLEWSDLEELLKT